MFTNRLHDDSENLKEKILSYEKRSLIFLNVICKITGLLLLLIVISSRNTALLPVGAITVIISSFGCFAVVYENRSLLLTRQKDKWYDHHYGGGVWWSFLVGYDCCGTIGRIILRRTKYSTLLFLFLASQITITGFYLLELKGPKIHRDLLFEKMYTFSTPEWAIASITACVQVTAAILAICVAKMLQEGKGEAIYRDIVDRELQDMALMLPNA